MISHIGEPRSNLRCRVAVYAVVLVCYLAAYRPAVSASCKVRTIKLRVVQGLVVDWEKRPAEGVFLRLSNKEGRVVARTSTDAQGRFRFPDVPSGKYFLNGEHPDFGPLGDSVEVSRWRAKDRGIVFVAMPGVVECSGMGQGRNLPEWALLKTPTPPKNDSTK